MFFLFTVCPQNFNLGYGTKWDSPCAHVCLIFIVILNAFRIIRRHICRMSVRAFPRYLTEEGRPTLIVGYVITRAGVPGNQKGEHRLPSAAPTLLTLMLGLALLSTTTLSSSLPGVMRNLALVTEQCASWLI